MKTKSKIPVPAGTLVLIGGKENKGEDGAPGRETPDGFIPESILQLFASLPKKKSAAIYVVTSGSAEQAASFADYKRVFHECGQSNVLHLHHNTRDEVLKDECEKLVADTDAIFFAGGDQLTLTSLYGGTAFLKALKEKYIRNKFIIGGTSAGAMAMSTPMIYAGNQEVQQVSGEIKVTTGLEFLRGVCIDTHFVHRSRFVRLAQVIATNPSCTGLGIEEDTAVIVTKGIDCEVRGSGTVIQIKGFGITESNMKDFTEKKPFTVRNLQVDILAAGDRFQIEVVNPPHQ